MSARPSTGVSCDRTLRANRNACTRKEELPRDAPSDPQTGRRATGLHGHQIQCHGSSRGSSVLNCEIYCSSQPRHAMPPFLTSMGPADFSPTRGADTKETVTCCVLLGICRNIGRFEQVFPSSPALTRAMPVKNSLAFEIDPNQGCMRNCCDHGRGSFPWRASIRRQYQHLQRVGPQRESEAVYIRQRSETILVDAKLSQILHERLTCSGSQLLLGTASGAAVTRNFEVCFKAV